MANTIPIYLSNGYLSFDQVRFRRTGGFALLDFDLPEKLYVINLAVRR